MANTTLTLLAAGSLRSAFLPLVAHFRQHTGLAVDAQFGPAGLLRERIEAGAPCAVFASANAAHPQALLQAGLVDELIVYIAPKLLGNAARGLCALPGLEELSQAPHFKFNEIRQVGPDVCLHLTTA